MRTTPERLAQPRNSRNLIITPASPEFSASGLIRATNASSSFAWSSANDPFAIGFALSNAAVITQLGWMNGTAAGGGVDVGVYTTGWSRLVSTGAQTGSGNSLWQFIDVADTALAPGRYYLAMARDNITANRLRVWGVGATVPAAALAGGKDSATNAYPLPSTLTNMADAATFNVVPMMSIAFKVPF